MFLKKTASLICNPKSSFILVMLVMNLSLFAQVPVVSSFFPESASTGATVIINGSNFSSTITNNIVFFGAARAVVITATTTSLSVLVPAGATYLPITITVNGLTGYSSRPFILSSIIGPITSESFNQAFLSENLFNSVQFQDIDGDGKPDAVVCTASSIAVMRNISNVGKVSFSPPQNLTTFGYFNYPVSFGDFDGDGRIDIASVSRIDFSTQKLAILRNTSTVGSISFVETYLTLPNFGKILVTDFNLDGKPDIAYLEFIGSKKVYVLKNLYSGAGISFASPQLISSPVASESPSEIISADLDNDGKSDLLICNYTASSIS
jgi:CO dehydrogenase/acetyl-CoA synthase epsilon subunit